MKNKEKKVNFTVRLSAIDNELLSREANKKSISVAEVIRRLIKKELG